MTLTLHSVCAASATTGTLNCPGLMLSTIELPWRHNEADTSCVPAGEYTLIRYLSPKHGQTWRLHAPALGVWGTSALAPEGMRTEVEIHPANWARELLGCIGVGLSGLPMLDPVTGQVEPAVQDSRAAFEGLRELLDGTSDEDSLVIERTGDYVEQTEG